MKKITFITQLIFGLFCNLAAQNLNIPSKFLQEVVGFPTMGCCPTVGNNAEYMPVLEDHFNDMSNFGTIWQTYEALDPNNPCPRFWDINVHEPIYWSADNVTTGKSTDENGNPIDVLLLKVEKVNSPITCTKNGVTYSAAYTAGMIWSETSYRYGKFEAKFKLPTGNTVALYPAFWLWGGDEIDVMEAWGYGDTPDDNSNMHWSNSIQNGPMVNPNSNFLYWSHRSPNPLPSMTKGVWHTLTCESTPYKIATYLDGTLVRESFRYYQICGGDTVGVECGNAFCDGPVIENLTISDQPLHIVFNLTLQPTYEWWGKTIAETNTTLPATLELAYIKVSQLKYSGASNTPNIETVWGACQNNDNCVTRFRDRALYESSPTEFCGKKLDLEIESSINVWWETGSFPCSNILLTADPGLNATLNCSNKNLSVSIDAENINEEYHLQVEVPPLLNSHCISEAGHILKHTIILIDKLDPISAILDQNQSIPAEGTVSVDLGIHTLQIPQQNKPPKYWWIVNGVTYQNQPSIQLNIIGGNNPVKLFLENTSNGCITEINYTLIGICPPTPPVSILLDQNIAIGPNTSTSVNTGQHFLEILPQNRPPKYWWIIDGIKYENQPSVEFFVKGGYNYVTLFIEGSEGCITKINDTIIGTCPPLPTDINLSVNGKLLIPHPTNSYNNLSAGTWEFVLNDASLVAAGYTYYFKSNGIEYRHTNHPPIPLKGVYQFIELHIISQYNCESTLGYDIRITCHSQPSVIKFDTVNKSTTLNTCQNSSATITTTGVHTFTYNYSSIIGSDIIIQFKDIYGNIMQAISDNGIEKTYKVLFPDAGLYCIEQTISTPTEPSCSKSLFYKFSVKCNDLKITKLDDDFIYNNQFAQINNGTIHKISVDASNIQNDSPIIYLWKITAPGNSVSMFTTPEVDFNFNVIGYYIIDYTIRFASGLSSCGHFTIYSQCFAPIISIDGITHNYIPSQIESLCLGQHIIKIENLEEHNGQLYYFAILKNGQLLFNTTINNVILNIELANYEIFFYYNIPGCGTTTNSFEIVGKTCGQNPPPTCYFQLAPNPASNDVNITSSGTAMYNGVSYTPQIRDIKVYDKYTIQRKHITTGDIPTYNLNIGDLPNNDFYIVEVTDQYNNVCRKTLLIAR